LVILGEKIPPNSKKILDTVYPRVYRVNMPKKKEAKTIKWEGG
jgi:hypothetical protein